MSIVLGYSAPIIGMGNSIPADLRLVLSAISAAQGEVIDLACLQSVIEAIKDNGEFLLALSIQAKSAAVGGAILDISCLYQLSKAIN